MSLGKDSISVRSPFFVEVSSSAPYLLQALPPTLAGSLVLLNSATLAGNAKGTATLFVSLRSGERYALCTVTPSKRSASMRLRVSCDELERFEIESSEMAQIIINGEQWTTMSKQQFDTIASG
jgi:hypothetical protein